MKPALSLHSPDPKKRVEERDRRMNKRGKELIGWLISSALSLHKQSLRALMKLSRPSSNNC